MNGKILIYIILLFSLVAAYYISLHNLDLSYNAKRGMLDDNGIFIQSPEKAYSRAVLYFAFFPLLIGWLIIGIIYELKFKCGCQHKIDDT